jgi:ComF family protein
MNAIYTVNGYEGLLRACIHALKYDGTTRLASPLGQLLARAYLAYHIKADVILPVPLHAERYKQRGYNHAELLAHTCADALGVPLVTNVLVRTRATRAQVGLTARERQQNVLNAFHVTATSTVYKRRVIIIDDVCTTGATLEACAFTLLAAGVTSVNGLVLARRL